MVNPTNGTSTWKRTSANGLLKEDKNKFLECETTNTRSTVRPTFDRIANVHSVEGPQFSTFIRVSELESEQPEFLLIFS